MSTAFRGRDIIDETVNIFVVAIIVLKGNLNHHAVFNAFTVDDIIVKRCCSLIQIGDVLLDTTLIMKFRADRFFLTQVCQTDLQTLGQKCNLSKTLSEHIVIKNGNFKHLRIRKEDNLGTSLFRRSDLFQVIHDLAALIALVILETVHINIDFKPG